MRNSNQILHGDQTIHRVNLSTCTGRLLFVTRLLVRDLFAVDIIFFSTVGLSFFGPTLSAYVLHAKRYIKGKCSYNFTQSQWPYEQRSIYTAAAGRLLSVADVTQG